MPSRVSVHARTTKVCNSCHDVAAAGTESERQFGLEADFGSTVCGQVKEAMVDDAQASIAALKTQLSVAQAEAAESAQALRHAEEDLSEHEAEEQRQHQSLRCGFCWASIMLLNCAASAGCCVMYYAMCHLGFDITRLAATPDQEMLYSSTASWYIRIRITGNHQVLCAATSHDICCRGTSTSVTVTTRQGCR